MFLNHIHYIHHTILRTSFSTALAMTSGLGSMVQAGPAKPPQPNSPGTEPPPIAVAVGGTHGFPTDNLVRFAIQKPSKTQNKKKDLT